MHMRLAPAWSSGGLDALHQMSAGGTGFDAPECNVFREASIDVAGWLSVSEPLRGNVAGGVRGRDCSAAEMGSICGILASGRHGFMDYANRARAPGDAKFR